jgi:integrase
MKLTQKAVDGIGLDRNQVVWDDDTPGLGLRVQAGKKSWIVRYRVAGVQRQKSLDGHLKLAKAREDAGLIRSAAVQGVDRIAEGRAKAEADRRQAEAARARSLGAIVEDYLPAAKKRLRPASYNVAKLYLEGPKYWAQLRDRPADELGRREILAVLQPWAGRVTSAQMLAHLSACLSWGVVNELLERNCAMGLKPPVEKVDRERVLTDSEIGALWAATAGDGTDTVEDRYAKILRLLLLTGQRRGEVGGMRRPELDLDQQLWRLPGARTKNKLPHDVPLSRQAKAILELQGGDPLFGKNGFREWWRAKQQLDTVLDLPEWTVHDLRRTVVTGMAEIGVSPHIVEAVVNHVSGHKGGVAGVYNRAKYSQEKRAALQRWADRVEQITAGEATSNVVEFGR